MAKEFSRTRRIGELMQRELAVLIQQELNDPRIGMVTVSGIDVSRDLATAKVYVTVFNDKHSVKETIKALNNAAGFLRREVGRRMVLRNVPSLQFIYDETMVKGNALASLIQKSVEEDKKRHKDDAEPGPGNDTETED